MLKNAHVNSIINQDRRKRPSNARSLWGSQNRNFLCIRSRGEIVHAQKWGPFPIWDLISTGTKTFAVFLVWISRCERKKIWNHFNFQFCTKNRYLLARGGKGERAATHQVKSTSFPSPDPAQSFLLHHQEYDFPCAQILMRCVLISGCYPPLLPNGAAVNRHWIYHGMQMHPNDAMSLIWRHAGTTVPRITSLFIPISISTRFYLNVALLQDLLLVSNPCFP